MNRRKFIVNTISLCNNAPNRELHEIYKLLMVQIIYG